MEKQEVQLDTLSLCRQYKLRVSNLMLDLRIIISIRQHPAVVKKMNICYNIVDLYNYQQSAIEADYF